MSNNYKKLLMLKHNKYNKQIKQENIITNNINNDNVNTNNSINTKINNHILLFNLRNKK